MTILNQVLDFSKIEAGRMTLEAVPFDAAGLCDDIVRLQSVRAKDKGVDLRLKNSASSVHVPGDPLRLRQILVNLVDNAIKFTERGEVVLGLDVAPPAADAIPLRFSVRDCGIGIPAAQRSRIFQHFTQATRPPPGSTGARDWDWRSASSWLS